MSMEGDDRLSKSLFQMCDNWNQFRANTVAWGSDGGQLTYSARFGPPLLGTTVKIVFKKGTNQVTAEQYLDPIMKRMAEHHGSDTCPVFTVDLELAKQVLDVDKTNKANKQ